MEFFRFMASSHEPPGAVSLEALKKICPASWVEIIGNLCSCSPTALTPTKRDFSFQHFFPSIFSLIASRFCCKVPLTVLLLVPSKLPPSVSITLVVRLCNRALFLDSLRPRSTYQSCPVYKGRVLETCSCSSFPCFVGRFARNPSSLISTTLLLPKKIFRLPWFSSVSLSFLFSPFTSFPKPWTLSPFFVLVRCLQSDADVDIGLLVKENFRFACRRDGSII